MYSPITFAARYIQHQVTASNSKGHGMHSPFVFELITHVLNDKKQYEDYQRIEKLRERLHADDRVIDVEDLGAGSVVDKGRARKVSSIAKNAAKSAKYGQLLYRLSRYYKPERIFELGTSLGISTAYLASGNPDSIVYSFEGAPEVASIAKENFAQLNIGNVVVVEGNFDVTLSSILKGLSKPGMVFIDGNHRKEPTIRYFLQLVERVDNDTMLIFDDIHWSQEMEEAWEEIRNHPEVRCSIDLFSIGILLFRREFMARQHFRIRF